MNRLKKLKKGSAIFVTGTPGTGKTTISSELARILHATHINPAEALSRNGELHGWDKRRRTAIAAPARLCRHVLSIASQIDTGLIIDSHIMFGLPESTCVKKVFVLRCHPSSLEKRLKGKGWTRQKIRENLLAEILDICLWDAVETYGERKILQIDTTHLTPRAVVEYSIQQLRTGQFRTGHEVDWLSTLENERSLERYVKST